MSIEAIAWAFKQPVKPAARKFVLIALADNADNYGICFPSYRHIEEKTSLTRRAIIKNIKALIEEGIITKAPRVRSNGSDTSNVYRLPLVEGCIDDHPLSALFPVGEGVNHMHPPSEPRSPRGEPYAPRGEPYAPPEPSSNLHLTKKEKKALSRDEFLRVISKGFGDGEFDNLNLTESVINIQSDKCWDWWQANDRVPNKAVIANFRVWLSNGLEQGKIKVQSQAKEKNVCNGVLEAEAQNPLQDWHGRIKPLVGDDKFTSWIRKLHWNGNGSVHAPSKFHADYVRDHFYNEIKNTTHNGVKIIPQPYQPEEQHESA